MPHKNLPAGVVQGPDGKFMSAKDAGRFEDFEVVPFTAQFRGDGHTSGTAVLEWDKVTEIEGEELIDFDDLLDRHRIAHLTYLEASLVVSVSNAPAAQVAQYGAMLELSGSPATSAARVAVDGDYDDVGDIEQRTGDMDDVDFFFVTPDTLDVPMRPLQVINSAIYEDETNATGGAGGPGMVDAATGPVPGTWDFDRRDEFYVNGSLFTAGGFAGTLMAHLTGIASFGIEDT